LEAGTNITNPHLTHFICSGLNSLNLRLQVGTKRLSAEFLSVTKLGVKIVALIHQHKLQQNSIHQKVVNPRKDFRKELLCKREMNPVHLENREGIKQKLDHWLQAWKFETLSCIKIFYKNCLV
jgi:hypothetical protein